MIAFAALAVSPVPAAPLPEISVILLSPDGDTPHAQDREYLLRRTWELLATMNDQGIVRIRHADHDPRTFAPCLSASRRETDARQSTVAECIAERLDTRSRTPLIAVLVEQMRWRSAAQQMSCIATPQGPIGRSPVHLRDIFHRYDDVRAGARRAARSCLSVALGGAR